MPTEIGTVTGISPPSQPSRSSSLLFQLDLAHEEYWQPFLLSYGCDDSILASATLLCNLEVRWGWIFPFARFP